MVWSVRFAALVGAALLSAPAAAQGPAARIAPASLAACHGYGCEYRTKFALSSGDAGRIARLFTAADTAAAERAAIARTVQIAEDRAAAAIGVRDQAKSIFGESRQRGQMDCIDESTNTRAVLGWIERSGLLRFHSVKPNRSRGMFVDGRYPHATAVIAETATGQVFAVDSWFEPAGGAPDIMPLKLWMTRGVMGER